MRNYVSIEPVRTLAALLVLGSAVIGLCALIWTMDPEVVAGIGFVWSAFVAFLASFFVRNEVIPVEAATAGD